MPRDTVTANGSENRRIRDNVISTFESLTFVCVRECVSLARFAFPIYLTQCSVIQCYAIVKHYFEKSFCILFNRLQTRVEYCRSFQKGLTNPPSKSFIFSIGFRRFSNSRISRLLNGFAHLYKEDSNAGPASNKLRNRKRQPTIDSETDQSDD